MHCESSARNRLTECAFADERWTSTTLSWGARLLCPSNVTLKIDKVHIDGIRFMTVHYILISHAAVLIDIDAAMNYYGQQLKKVAAKMSSSSLNTLHDALVRGVSSNKFDSVMECSV
eukprot:scaffold79201_cov21-Prasinocladus_malaysianus.AAC.1